VSLLLCGLLLSLYLQAAAMDEWAYSTDEVKRITRLAAYLARRHKPGGSPIISCDKANVLASSRLWRRVTEETVKSEFPDLKISHQLADSTALIMVKNPRSLNGILLCDDTFGDLLSDVAGGIPGTLGVMPSASLSGVPGEDKHVNALYEPTHGSAPS
jgi:3-isopropylmalate dehydrogenase